MYKRYSILLNNILLMILSWGLENAGAQNLVSNPSFEEFFILPPNYTITRFKNTEQLPRWTFLNTPDYFNRKCDNKITGVPTNFAGNSSPKQGMGYAGLILRSDPVNYKLSPHYIEHLQNELEAPMEPGQLYCCSLYTILAKNSGFAVDGLGMLFTNDAVRFYTNEDAPQYQPQIENNQGNILAETGDWMLVSGLYRAHGGERYITIGDFRPLAETGIHRIRTKLSHKMNYFAYYYIDMVSVIPITDASQCQCTANSYTVQDNYVWIPPKKKSENTEDDGFQDSNFGKIVYGKPVELENIYFDFDKFDLLPQSFEELDKLYQLVAQKKDISIELAGHTDSLGESKYNRLLSQNRAKSVADYLISKGIASSQLRYYGYGSTVPVAANDTEEGRQANRRVEFIINKIHDVPQTRGRDADPFD